MQEKIEEKAHRSAEEKKHEYVSADWLSLSFKIMAAEKRCNKFVETVSTDFIKSIAAAFKSNTELTSNSLAFPMMLAISTNTNALFDKLGPTIKQALELVGKNPKADDWAEVLKTLLNSDISREDMRFIKKSCEQIESVISKDDALHRSLNSVMNTSICSSWTAFECLAGDLWETALNHDPRVLATAILNNDGGSSEVTGIKGKSIEVFLLNKYNYDIQDKMGTILREKYNFSDARDVKKAYDQAFKFDASKLNFLSDLHELAQCRHLILHRAGIIDNKFIQKVKTNQSIGDYLEMSPSKVVSMNELVIDRGSQLLQAIDSWFLSKRKHPEHSAEEEQT